jgi:hypothetical protein
VSGLLHSMLKGKDYLYFAFNLNKEFLVQFWECPGLFLSEEELGKLVEDLREVARDGQDGKPVPLYGVLAGEKADLDRRVITVVRSRETGQAIAFGAMLHMDLQIANQAERVTHLGLTFIAPAAQRKRISHVLYGLANFLLFFKGGMRRSWVSNVTQVPTVVGLVASHYDHVFPSPYPGARQSFHHLQMARAIMRDYRAGFGVGEEAGFDEDRQVITNAYTGGSDDLKKTYQESPKYKDELVNDFCNDELDYERGDDFLQLGNWGMSTTIRFLRLKMPEGALSTLLFQGATLLVVGLFAPALRWFFIDEYAEKSQQQRGA